MRTTLIAISAIFVFSCGKKEPPSRIQDPETTATQISYNHKTIESKNGQKNYRMETPILKRYELAAEPFLEFPEGIKVETFDSLENLESSIVADYAHFNETTEIWTAKGNVVARSLKEDRSLYTELLYWDQQKELIYTPANVKVINQGSPHVGKGFRANQSFSEWELSSPVGQIEIDTTRNRPEADTTEISLPQTDSLPKADSLPAAGTAPEEP